MKTRVELKTKLIALVMCSPAFLALIWFALVLANCAPKPADYYPQYCLATDTAVLHQPVTGTGIVHNLPAGKQVFPGLEQSGDYVKVEYRMDEFGTLSGYVPKAAVIKCNR